ncbi:polysaccharide ABC transporter ATP-binding protein [Eisenbergiella tayi]|jgi:ABC transporter, permease protein|uniref:Polysaccharide ABC transporter ATP-binding protein n=2 Tax=Eisenbergiella tayi TaxID=1432052 RepID=A0ABX3ASX9_9FIRM|nr:polysaccharide ABC transporter ATP-binding protein [Eisenbergiella tayi]RJW40334.1 sugar ABC transporter permease [Lachnospiraceae bacterium TF09-5]RJW43360.1 sugar ABC transporter permease [Lachnospiraceae bacterium OM02-31]RJW56034.1 sugar ABC transporter permease [Lachnospiraceae bacterium OM02-3]ODR45990.1 polysaccharide ABC transporter ATP-binding protein [Eisenbergiella tayi]
MLFIPIIYFIVFHYLPLGGIVVAFKQYNIFQGIWDSPWVGLAHFKEVFASGEFRTALKNTIVLNLGELFITFPFPIVLAVLLNEMSNQRMKKLTQTVLYLPHFLSMVVIAGIVYQVFGTSGIVNNVLSSFHIGPVNFVGDSSKWRAIYWGTGIWMGAGYGMIVYLAAMAGINVELYDAAYMDGAGRWKRIWHVTLPQIRPTVVTMTIMNVGKILSISFERPYLMGNVLVQDVSSVISTYVYSVGLQAGRYDFATAVGLFQSIVAVCMVVAANQVAKRLGEEGIM